MYKKLLAVLLACALLAVVLSGCAKQTAQQTAPSPQKIVIGYTSWTGYGALFVAKEKGMFKNRGLDVELQAIEGVGDRKQSLVANKTQAMAASLDVSVSAAGEGVPMKFVWAFDASDGADGLIVRKGKGVEKIADLKGKEIALHKGSSSHFFLNTVLEQAGMNDSDVKLVDMKADETASAFMAGKVDAAVTWEPHLSKLKQSGEIVMSTTKDTPGLVADVLAFREDFVKNNPTTIQAVVDALAEATDYIHKNPDESYKIIATAFKMKPEDVSADAKSVKFYNIEDNLAFYGTADKPGPIYNIGQRAGAFYVKLKILSQAPDMTKFVDHTFINQVRK